MTMELQLPLPALSRAQRTPNDSVSQIVHDHTGGGTWPLKSKVKNHGAKGRIAEAEDEDEEIGVHMWERRGKLINEVPWFRTEGHA